jgi:hypothetical protein
MTEISTRASSDSHAVASLDEDPLRSAVERLRQEIRTRPHLNLQEFVLILGPEGPVIAALLLSLPFLQPFPLMGISTPMGFTIALSGWAMMTHRKIWLPRWLGEVKLRSSIIGRTLDFFDGLERRFKVFLRTDTGFQQSGFRRRAGLAICIHGFLLGLPLPLPFSNTLPAWVAVWGGLAVLFASPRAAWAMRATVLINVAYWGGTVYLIARLAHQIGTWNPWALAEAIGRGLAF